jgi:hypothetical protein
MSLFQRGKVHAGQIVLADALPLPEDTEVMVQIDPIPPSSAMENVDARSFASLPCFGMWKDREDMLDSTTWVSKERQKWLRRADHPD